VTLILNLGEPFGGLPRSFAAGIADRCVSIEDAGDLACLDVKLTPLGAYTLCGWPMDELVGQAIDLENVYGAQPVRDLVGRLQESAAAERRLDVLDAFLLARAEDGPSASPAVEWAWQRLNATYGLVPIGQLATEVGWSRRHLIAQFRRQVGLPPKRLARILRFNRVLQRLRRASAVRWAEVAYECGYYDQAHLIHDFRDFARTTPTEFLRDREVNSFQDTFEHEAYDRPAVDLRDEERAWPRQPDRTVRSR
jgi:AraC-like DNA-binding protein